MTIRTLNEADDVLDDEALVRHAMHDIADTVADDAGIPLGKTTWLVCNGKRYRGPPCKPLLRFPGEGT